MKVFNIEQFIKDNNASYLLSSTIKKRKTYDWIYLNTLLGLFNYTYSINDTIYYTNNKKIKFDLIKIYKSNKDTRILSNKFFIKVIKKVFNNVEIKEITRQYKYAPEQKEVFIALRTL